MPGRNRKSAKDAGTRFETFVGKYLRLPRRAKTGRYDRGDLECPGVIECKDYGGNLKVGEWIGESQRERDNADSEWAVVVAKRRGSGKPDEQYVFMTLKDFKWFYDRVYRKSA